ncbi:cellulase family glycosylhydrolase [Gilvimarinus chinensis]|uniref:cellulase family glycosylhydrolase n=1 Tax=Gilvimarinus chinensis TaxID=396005 RepID=UPI00035E1929|nr:cellulase family glycosylhydrolase [Gilvimarinus chinensis]
MKVIQLALLGLLTCAATVLAQETIYVDDGKIKTASGEILVMRGFNEMFVWSTDPTGERLIPEIAQSGANTLRLVWSYKNANTDDLESLVNRTVEHKMVPVVECHDATGKWGEELQKCVDFWKDPVVFETIESQKRWAILNIANEAGAHDINDQEFVKTYKKAISELRQRGYTVPIMVDAAVWGQDISQLIRTAPQLIEHDPLHNIIFSAHSYWPQEQALENYRLAAASASQHSIALIIGEGPSVTRVGQCENPKPLPYLEGMEILQNADIGWLNWSWGGMKNGDCDQYLYFDISEQGRFGRWTHEPGAQIVAMSPNSVMQTSKRPASFYPDGKVDVSGVYLHLENATVEVGETARYTALIAPVNAHNKNYSVVWSGDEETLLINSRDGTVTGKRPGQGELILTSEMGNLSWSVPVTVIKSQH